MRRLNAAELTLVLALALTAPACEDTRYRQIGSEINIISKRSQDPSAAGARRRLITFGQAAIPQIETALHTAPEAGRLHLVAALDAIGDGEAVPILRHFAVYDGSEQVRAACRKVLAGWSQATDARAERARAAAARVAELERKGEGPMPIRR